MEATRLSILRLLPSASIPPATGVTRPILPRPSGKHAWKLLVSEHSDRPFLPYRSTLIRKGSLVHGVHTISSVPCSLRILYVIVRGQRSCENSVLPKIIHLSLQTRSKPIESVRMLPTAGSTKDRISIRRRAKRIPIRPSTTPTVGSSLRGTRAVPWK